MKVLIKCRLSSYEPAIRLKQADYKGEPLPLNTIITVDLDNAWPLSMEDCRGFWRVIDHSYYLTSDGLHCVLTISPQDM